MKNNFFGFISRNIHWKYMCQNLCNQLNLSYTCSKIHHKYSRLVRLKVVSRSLSGYQIRFFSSSERTRQWQTFSLTYLTRDYYDGFINDRVKYGSGKIWRNRSKPATFSRSPFYRCPTFQLQNSKLLFRM